MTFDWQVHLRETAEYLVEMSTWQGWTDQARYRRDALLEDPMYGEALKAEIRKARAASPSTSEPASSAPTKTSSSETTGKP